MDLHSIKLRLADRHARVVVADQRGERGCDLEGEAFSRLAESAAPLIVAVQQRAAGAGGSAGGVTVRALSVDTVARVIRASLVGGKDGPGISFGGPDYRELEGAVPDLARAALSEIRPRRPDPAGTPSEASFWDQLYRGGGDGWELGRATPPLSQHFARHPATGLRALVVGAGRGHEARLLAATARAVVAIDLSSEAVAEARALDAAAGGTAVEYRQADLFELPSLLSAGAPPVSRAATEFPGSGAMTAPWERFDLVVEHCCFCAIEPRRRGEYVEAMAEALAPGGRLVGLFYAHGRAGGPPFSVTAEALTAAFAGRFLVEEMEVARDSVAARAGQEIFARFRLR